MVIIIVLFKWYINCVLWEVEQRPDFLAEPSHLGVFLGFGANEVNLDVAHAGDMKCM